VCGRYISVANLSVVEMPGRKAAEIPRWLRDAGCGEDLVDAWFDQMDALFNCETYLHRYFQTTERIAEAEAALETAREEVESNASNEAAVAKLAQAQRWLHRVRDWAENLRTDLRADAIAAPGDADKHWLFTVLGCVHWPSESGLFTCRCCKECLGPLCKITATKELKVSMPQFARARGLWGGPLPTAIQNLTALEKRILRLGRVHSNVERISLKTAMWAKGHTEALPAYVSKSSYVFAQNPETFSRSLCLLPQDLITEFAVHLVGCAAQKLTPEILRRLPRMLVSVERLRSGIHWYCTHCWPWMLATKELDYQGLRQQGEHFEKLLASWQKEIGDRSEDVPRVLRDYAATTVQKESRVFNQGPADASASAVIQTPKKMLARRKLPFSSRI